MADAAGPLVEHHTATGVPYLVVVAKNLDSIEGLTVEESRGKLTELVLPGLGGQPREVHTPVNMCGIQIGGGRRINSTKRLALNRKLAGI
jgi:hypothetical protein